MRELTTLLRSRFQFWTQPAALPLVLLLSALSTVFLFGHDRGRFYRDGHHDWITSQGLAQAVNLSPEHNFLLFISRTLDADGAPSYATYARWPIGSYALVKLAILPFEGNLSAQIYAARLVMLLLFSASAVLACLALARLTGDGWIALTATLLAFSSYYALYYNDAFVPDAVPGFFGVLLTFHGMVLFVQEGRLRQLMVKSCAALLLCWHVYALLLPFIVLGMASELIRLRAGSSASRSLASQLKRYVAALLFSRYLTLGVVTLLFGMAVLSFNLGNDYRAFDGEVPLMELPTVQSMTYRFGADDEFNEGYAEMLAWGNFLENQFYRIARATLPFAISPFDNHAYYEDKDYLGVIVGALATGVAVMGLLVARHKMLLATLVLSGFCWALPLRNFTAFHDFQSLFYIGVPLTIFSVILLYIRKLSSDQFVSVLAVAALLLFVLSSAEMAGVGHDPSQARTEDDAGF